MKKISQEEFNNLETINGVKQCPTGDYSEIKRFAKYCIFGERCSFAENCSFGERCSFGEDCSFAENCSFGERCSFGAWCGFAENCSFGERCSFENGHQYQGDYPYYAFIGLGSRKGSKTYVFNFTDGIHVRCGCFFGTVEEFKEKVKKDYSAEHFYIRQVDLIEEVFNGELKIEN